MSRLAVVLFNLGGPDRPESIKPFLFNLFNDPAIIGLPNPLRWLVATIIARRRAPTARLIYSHIGGKSPLLELTREQAAALEERLAGGGEVRVFVAMRYWHPLSGETAAAVKAYDPDEVVLLPLYPQYSRTTTGSSIAAWKRAAAAAGLAAPTRAVCCYPTEPGLIEAQAALVRKGIAEAADGGRVRVLFSAHGLPKKVIAGGDPYAWQVERTAEAIAAGLGEADLDWVVCYQSRVGPLKWIGPSLGDELRRAALDGVAVVVAPIAFVSEHSETLVELDMEYRVIARELGIGKYVRVGALGTAAGFIDGLARLVGQARTRGGGFFRAGAGAPCAADLGGCPLLENGLKKKG